MQISVSSTLTLFHDGQFWVGIVEHVEDGRFGAARIVFGAEPSDEAILQFIMGNWERLTFFGNEAAEAPKLARSPKRRQRDAAKELKKLATSTKAQQAIAAQREGLKANAVHARKQKKLEDRQLRFERRKAKLKKKRRGH